MISEQIIRDYKEEVAEEQLQIQKFKFLVLVASILTLLFLA